MNVPYKMNFNKSAFDTDVYWVKCSLWFFLQFSGKGKIAW